MENIAPYFLALACSGLLPRTTLHLLEQFGGAKAVWEASEKSLLGSGLLSYHACKNFLMFRETFHIEKNLKALEACGIRGISLEDKDYPELLKHISDPPIFIFLKGDPVCLKGPCLAIVGSRNGTPLGKIQAQKLAESLAYCGFTIVSGLARGIDRAAHEGALECGKTVAVLGSGLKQIYPFEHQALAEKISRQGCVISEFPPETPPLPWNFPRRNRIISGLSLGVIVVEAREKSGALITAHFALEQGREVFAFSNSKGLLSKGTQALIEDGGKAVKELKDILEEFSYLSLPGLKKEPENQKEELSKKILETLKNKKEGSCIEELAREAKANAKEVSAALVLLETEGRISRLPGNRYISHE
jgi:DNA processing protein